MARKDIHAPSRIMPEDYEFVAFDYYGPDAFGLNLSGERAAFRAHMDRTGGKFSGHEHGGSCHICGASAMYVAKFHHKPSNKYIVTGEDCAAKMDMGDAVAFRSFRAKVGEAREAAAGKNKAKAVLEKAGAGAAWAVYEAGGGNNDAVIVGDMVARLIRYGSISDKAMGFMKVLLDRIENAPRIAAEKAAAKALEMANAKPVPVVEGRIVIRGEVLSVKLKESFYGSVLKMLVKSDEGFKVWGSVPSSIEVGKGDKVEFSAKLERSTDDEYFGFFSRPSKASIIEKAKEVA